MSAGGLVGVVLAGKDADPGILGGEPQKPSKFFMDFGNGFVGDRIVRALDSSNCCKSIYVVGPEPYISNYSFKTKNPLYMMPQGKGRLENMMIAVDDAEKRGEYKPGDHIILSTGDLPLLEARAIEELVTACEKAEDADVYIGLIPAELVDQSLTGLYKQDLIPIHGLYMHSDVYLIRPSSMTEEVKQQFEVIASLRRLNRGTLGQVLDAASDVSKIASLKGIMLFFRVMSGFFFYHLGYPNMSNRVTKGIEKDLLEVGKKLFGIQAKFVLVNQPSLGCDFDYPWQLETLLEYDKHRIDKKEL